MAKGLNGSVTMVRLFAACMPTVGKQSQTGRGRVGLDICLLTRIKKVSFLE
jgi:hypothetical protein